MKLLYIVIDGMGDLPLKELSNRTPLEAAKTPNLDALARKGKMSVNKAYQIAKSKEGVKSRVKLAPPSFGMRFARMAISDLERIQDDDVERDRAVALVKEWIEKHERKN